MSRCPSSVLPLSLVVLHLLAVVANTVDPESTVLELVIAIDLVFLAAWLQHWLKQ
jgi:hypothetical protein